MTDIIATLSVLGEALRAWAVQANAGAALVLAAGLIADRLLARRVGGGARLWLYGAAIARAALPVGFVGSVGLLRLGTRSAAGAIAVEGDPVVSVATGTSDAPARGAGFWIAGVYLAVAVVLLARWAYARARLASTLRAASPLHAGGATTDTPGVAVLMHETLGPLVAGVLRPRIVVPAALCAPDRAEALAAALAHEAAHVARRDPLLHALVQLACIAVWPVLPVWLAAGRMRRLCEMACDERALAGRSTEDRRRYGEILVAMAEGRPPVTGHALVPSFGWDLPSRIRALRWHRRWPSVAQFALVAALGATVVTCSGAPGQETAPAANGAAAPAPVGTKRADPRTAERAADVDVGRRKNDPIVTITRDGDIYIETRKVELDTLETALAEALRDRGSQTILLRGPHEVLLKKSVDIMAIAKRAGARNIAILTPPGRAPADIVPGQASVQGGLDKDLIRRTIRRHINEVKFCYEQELGTNAQLAGRVQVHFTIAATGAVIASSLESSTLGNPRVENCIVTAVRRWEFPEPSGGTVEVSYPFVLTPAPPRPEPSSPTAPKASAATDSSAGASGHLDPQIVAREVRARRGAIEACYERRLRVSPLSSGLIVVKWTITTAGEVSAVEIVRDTVGDQELALCAKALISRWRFPAPEGGSVDVEFPFTFTSDPNRTR